MSWQFDLGFVFERIENAERHKAKIKLKTVKLWLSSDSLIKFWKVWINDRNRVLTATVVAAIACNLFVMMVVKSISTPLDPH